MVVYGRVVRVVLREQFFLDGDLFTGVEYVCFLIVAVSGQAGERGFIVLDEVLTRPGGCIFSETEGVNLIRNEVSRCVHIDVVRASRP